MAIIDHGRILVEDTPTALKNSVGAQKMYQLHLRDQNGHGPLVETLKQMDGVTSAEATGDGVRVMTGAQEGPLSDILAAASPFGLRDLTITEASLETVFIQLTGRELRE